MLCASAPIFALCTLQELQRVDLQLLHLFSKLTPEWIAQFLTNEWYLWPLQQRLWIEIYTPSEATWKEYYQSALKTWPSNKKQSSSGLSKWVCWESITMIYDNDCVQILNNETRRKPDEANQFMGRKQASQWSEIIYLCAFSLYCKCVCTSTLTDSPLFSK